MNPIEIGNKFEQEAELILLEKGYDIIEHTSQKDRMSYYDFYVKKEGKDYYIEVRGRQGKYNNYFMFSKKKLNNLRFLEKEVLLLLINEYGHIIISLKEIKSFSKPIRLGDKIIYCVDVNKNKIRKEPTVNKEELDERIMYWYCSICGKEIFSIWFKQFEYNKKLHIDSHNKTKSLGC